MSDAPVRIDGPRGARPVEFGEVLDFQNFVFRSGRGAYPSMAGEMPHLYRECNSNYLRIVRENGPIKGCVCIYPAHIRWDDAALKIGGIGGVSTHPESRGKGYARALLEDSINVMKDEDFDVSILWGIRELYRKFGWEQSGELWEFVLDPNTIAPLPTALDGEIVTDPRDPRMWEGARDLHAGLKRGVERDLELSEIMLNIVAYSRVAMLFREGKAVAYVIYRPGGRVHIADYAGDTDAVLALSRRAFEENNGDTLVFSTPKNDPVIAAWLIERGYFCHPHYTGMILVLRPQNVLDQYGVTNMRIDPADDGWDVTWQGKTIRYNRCEISKLLFGPEKKPGGHVHPMLPLPIYYGMIDHM